MTNGEKTPRSRDKRTVFWLGPSAECLWEPWTERRKRLFHARNPHLVPPGGSWRKVELGHFLPLVPGGVARELLEGLLREERTPARKLLAEALSGWEENPLQALLLGRLYSERRGELLPPAPDTRLPRLLAHLSRGEAYPAPKGRKLGLLVLAEDELAAASWELALLALMRPRLKLASCPSCGKVLVGRRRKCLVCRQAPPAPPSERRRFLCLLAERVWRGEMTPGEREGLKCLLDEKGLEAAREAYSLWKRERRARQRGSQKEPAT